MRQDWPDKKGKRAAGAGRRQGGRGLEEQKRLCRRADASLLGRGARDTYESLEGLSMEFKRKLPIPQELNWLAAACWEQSGICNKAATDEEVDSLKGAFVKYAQALDLKTSNAAGDKGALKRGNEMINATTNGYDASVQKLADGKAIFLKQGNWVYTNVEKVNKEVAQRLTFLPVKLPVTADDIKVEGLTPEKMNSSIPVFVPMYYAVNAKAIAFPRRSRLVIFFRLSLNLQKQNRSF